MNRLYVARDSTWKAASATARFQFAGEFYIGIPWTQTGLHVFFFGRTQTGVQVSFAGRNVDGTQTGLLSMGRKLDSAKPSEGSWNFRGIFCRIMRIILRT